MNSSIQISSLINKLTYLVVMLALSACGPGFDDESRSERRPREPSEIEIRYKAMEAERNERMRSHTGEGPLFTEEEIAEFKRVEQRYHKQLEAEAKQRQEEENQNRREEAYRFCLDGDSGYCNRIFQRKVEDHKEDQRAKTVRIVSYLPGNVFVEYYFGLQGEGCTSADPVNTWTAAETVLIEYTGDGRPPPKDHWRFGRGWGTRLAQCDMQLLLRTADVLYEWKVDLEFVLQITPTIDDVLNVCSDGEPFTCGEFLKLTTDRSKPASRWDRETYYVTVENWLPGSLSYEYYFELSGTGCECELANQWITSSWNQANIRVMHAGEYSDPGKNDGTVTVECEISPRIRVEDSERLFVPIFKPGFYESARSETTGTVIMPFTVKPG